MNLKHAAAQGALWNLLENAGNQIATFVVFLVLARLLEPSAFGLVSMAASLLGLAWIFVEQGLSLALIQRSSLSRRTLNTAFWLNAASSLLALTLFSVFADKLAQLYRTPELSLVLRVLVWPTMLPALVAVHQALLLRDLRFRTQALRRLIAICGGGGVGVVMAWRGFGIWSLLGKQVAEAILDCCALWWTSSWRPSREFSTVEARELFGFGSRIVGTTTLGYLTRRADDFVVGFVLGATLLGYYAVAFRAIVLVSEVALRAAQRTAEPLFARLQGDTPRQQRAYYSAIELSAAMACPAFFGLSLIAPEFCLMVFGERWAAAIPAMQVLGMVGAALSISIYTAPLLTAIGKPHWLLRYTLLQSVLSVLLSSIASHWGIVAVAVGYVMRAYVELPITLWLVRKAIGIEPVRVMRLLFAPVAASFAMAVAVSGLRHVAGALPPTLMFALIVVLGAACYVSVMLLVARDTVARFVSLVRQLRSAPTVS